MNHGCEYEQKSFKVGMAQKEVINLCHTCVNNKYHGGSVEICDSCKGNDKYVKRNS